MSFCTFCAVTSCFCRNISNNFFTLAKLLRQAWQRGSVYSYYSDRSRFDSEPRHLSNHRARHRLILRLDSFSKNHRLNTPYPTHGVVGAVLYTNTLTGKAGAWILLWRNVSKPGSMCMNMNTYRLEPNGQGDRDGHCSNALSGPCSFLSFSKIPFVSFPNLLSGYHWINELP